MTGDPVYLDWSRHPLALRPGKCPHCNGRTRLRDENGKPSHKTCAELARAGRPPVKPTTTQDTIGGL